MTQVSPVELLRNEVESYVHICPVLESGSREQPVFLPSHPVSFQVLQTLALFFFLVSLCSPPLPNALSSLRQWYSGLFAASLCTNT